MARERLPDERQGTTHHFTVITKCRKLKCIAGKVEGQPCRRCNGEGLEEIKGYIQTGLYPDGRVGEVFIRVGRASDEFVMLDQWAIAFSVALQHGAPLAELCAKFRGQHFWPDGPTTNDKISRCSSLTDYAARWLMDKYGPKKTASELADDGQEAA